jgi:hypothetical protein
MLAVYRRIVRDELLIESRHAVGAVSDATLYEAKRQAGIGTDTLVRLITHLYERAHGKQ